MKKKILILVLILGMAGTVSAIPQANLHYGLNDSDSTYTNYGSDGGTASEYVSGSVNYQIPATSYSDGLGVEWNNAAGYQQISTPGSTQNAGCSWQSIPTGDTENDGSMVQEAWDGSGGDRWINMFWKAGGELHLHAQGSGGTTTFSAITYNVSSEYDVSKFHLYCWTFDNGDYRLYVDGNQEGFYSSSWTNMPSMTTNFYLNAFYKEQSSSVTASGDTNMDDSWLWLGTKPTQSEIQTLYNEGSNNAPTIDSVDYSPDDPLIGESIDTYVNASDTDGDDLTATVSAWRDSTQLNNSVSMSEPSTNEFQKIDLFTVDQTGNYTIQYEVSDGTSTTKQNQTFEVTEKPPSFEIIDPKNQTYGSTNVSWKIDSDSDGDGTTGETVDLTIYEDNVQVDSATITEGENASGTWTSSEGNHEFKARLEEQNDGQSTEKTVNFEVDTTAPDINITDPAENSTTKDLSNITLNYTVTDLNLDSSSCQYSKDGGTNISVSNCENTSFQFGSVGNHSVTLWAKDTLGNWGSETNSWFADQENTISLEDSETSNTIQDFQVTFDNGTKSLGGSTTDGSFEWLTSEAPKGGSVNVTLKAENYVTKTLNWNISDSYSQDNTIQMDRAGFTFSVYDEQKNIKLDNPVIVEMSNSTGGTKTFSLGGKLESSNNVNNPGNAFDGDTSTSASDGAGDSQTATLIGVVGPKQGSNQLSVNYRCNDREVPVELRNVDTSSWEQVGTIGDYDNTVHEGTKTFSFNNGNDQYNGRVRFENFEDFCQIREVYIDNYDKAEYDIQNVPSGDVAVRVDDIDYFNEYQSRTYDLSLDQYSRVSLRSYLLEKGEGIFMSIETLTGQGESLSGALVNVQRSLDGNFRTVSQKVTGTDGSSSFYLDPDTQYKAIASHPSYSTFEGTFSPTNYQYDPLQIQLGNKDQYNFSTRWDTVDYKLTPEERFLNKSQVENIEWTVTDGESDLSEFGLRLKYRNGTLIQTEKIQSSPSGGTVNVSINGSEYEQDTEFLVEAYFTTSGKEYRIEKVYEFARSWTAGIFSLSKILDTNGDGMGDTSKGLFALLVTGLVGASLGKRFDRDGGGFVAVMVLGIFTIGKWFPFEIWTITFLALLGIYLYR